MIDPDRATAVVFEPLTVTVDRGRLAFFASATGQTDPVYSDVDAAKAAGHPDVPVPPTFLFGLEMERPEAFGWLEELGVDLRRVLHGEQSFTYHALAHAGDTVTLRPRITGAYAKKDLDFVVKRTEITRGGERIADATTTIVVR
ncbi:MaoC family dehydratase N-terminal domain-containing protein [Pseudonocardia endophytica]|uniref:MaoC dehydratase-like protein n=1 Tax=Pseudonocardia endophytica TaxID=401976 RepID=A0A4R1HWU7_PSEEN|nr:MaoC family dehydratase N-terminal domain-containing protein [Pseudonocardia endophytica]TCK26828.1 MaoC dehydratase-like protein [Pseudonocardia endophytica]